MSNHRPRLVITLGDVAGIGPEIVAKAWSVLQKICRPIVIGDVGWMRDAVRFAAHPLDVIPVRSVSEGEASPERIPCLQGTAQDLCTVVSGQVSAAAGRAAYDFLCAAID